MQIGVFGRSADHRETCQQLFIVPFIDEEMPPGWVFLQYGASNHRNHRTLEFLEVEEVHLLEWPAKSQGLNPTEKLWVIAAREVHAGCQQFKDVGELKGAVLEAWDNIGSEMLKTLLQSIQRRCRDCFLVKGGPTKF